MGLFKFLGGKSAEDLEKQGDGLFNKGAFGPAKIEYEKALAKHQKRPTAAAMGNRLNEKIVQAKESLAREHIENALDLMESGCLEDARELIGLSLELTADDALKKEAGGLIQQIKSRIEEQAMKADMTDAYEFSDEDEMDSPAWDEADPEDVEEDEAYFNSLISPLPAEEQEDYLNYGRSFIVGYIKLNQGAFDIAKDNLSAALEENYNKKTYIPLELATCCLNLEEYDEAESLLTGFIPVFPFCLRAYQVLCETLWARQKYEEARGLLAGCPEDIRDTPEITLLAGETLVQSGKPGEAAAIYQSHIARNGDNDLTTRALAGVHEIMGETASANALYAQLLNTCSGCGRRPDVHLKQRFADTSFALNERSVKILELYLDLAREDPFHQGVYYDRVAAIYRDLGNEAEALRFQRISKSRQPGEMGHDPSA